MASDGASIDVFRQLGDFRLNMCEIRLAKILSDWPVGGIRGYINAGVEMEKVGSCMWMRTAVPYVETRCYHSRNLLS